jgi:hypothetical protein
MVEGVGARRLGVAVVTGAASSAGLEVEDSLILPSSSTLNCRIYSFHP